MDPTTRFLTEIACPDCAGSGQVKNSSTGGIVIPATRQCRKCLGKGTVAHSVSLTDLREALGL